MSIVPLGLNRISIPLQANRAYYNIMSAQSSVAKSSEQLESQRQYQYGSDSPYNASATLSVQSQMERKAQNATNIQSTQGFLTASDSTLAQFNSLTDDVRGLALDAVNTTTSDTQRSVLAATTNQVIQQLYNFSNNSYQGRYLFAGSTTATMPFQWGEGSTTINYQGANYDVYSWSDTDLLSRSNINGVDAFGAISDPVRGKIDLNPSPTSSTLLKNLNRGDGVDKGSLRLTYTEGQRTYHYDIDLSKCVTLADVEKAIEGSKNPYFSVNVDLTGNGLTLSLPAGTAGTVQVSEVGKGTVARQLGIPTGVNLTSDKPLVGSDLNPSLVATTSVTDILGTKSRLALEFSGANNDLDIVSLHNGQTYTDANGQVWPLNDVTVTIQADTTMVPGNEYVEYDPDSQTLRIHIHPDSTSANDIVRAFDKAREEGSIPPFEARPSGRDQQNAQSAGTGIVSYLPGSSVVLGTTSGGSGTDFDRSGLQIVNGNTVYNISFENCNTISDILAELNDPKYSLYATINSTGTGINIQSRISGADFCIGENGGSTATQIGVRTLAETTLLSECDFGRGVSDYDGPGNIAQAVYESTTPNSSLLLTARDEGKQWNDYTLKFVPTTDPQGKVVVSMNEEEKTITIGINVGTTTACEVIDAFDSQPGPKQYFTLELDTVGKLNTGSGVVYDGSVVTAGGMDGGIDFTVTRNDGTVLEVDIKGAKTIEDVLRIINEHPDNRDGLLVATLAKNGNGIELTDSSFGGYTTRVDRTLLSTSAIELGLISAGQEYRTSTYLGERASLALDFGTDNSALLITAKSVGSYAEGVQVSVVEGTAAGFLWDASSRTLQFTIVPGVTTANDLAELFQSQASDTVRSMFEVQNGTNSDGTPSNGSGTVSAASDFLSGGTDSILTGDDANPQETKSLFNALIRLQNAMETNDVREIERATAMLDELVDKLNAARATIGVMQNSLDNVQERLSDESIQHEATLNHTLWIDFADATLAYTTQMLAYQASMQVTSAVFQMSLLNYI